MKGNGHTCQPDRSAHGYPSRHAHRCSACQVRRPVPGSVMKVVGGCLPGVGARCVRCRPLRDADREQDIPTGGRDDRYRVESTLVAGKARGSCVRDGFEGVAVGPTGCSLNRPDLSVRPIPGWSAKHLPAVYPKPGTATLCVSCDSTPRGHTCPQRLCRAPESRHSSAGTARLPTTSVRRCPSRR